HAPGELDGHGGRKVLVDVVNQLHLFTELHSQVLHQFRNGVHVSFFVESGTGETSLGPPALTWRDLASATVTAHLRANVPEAAIRKRSHVLGDFVHRAAIGMAVARHRIPHFPAEEIEYGHSGALAF